MNSRFLRYTDVWPELKNTCFTGAEAAPAAAEAGAKAAGAAEAAGTVGALEGGGALAGGASFAQPTALINAGLLPEASFAQSALAAPGGAFATGAAGGALAGGALADPSNAALFPGESASVGSPPSAWQQAQGAWNNLGPLGQQAAKTVAGQAVQSMMGDGNSVQKQLAAALNQSYGGRQAAAPRAGLYGTGNVDINPDATIAQGNRPAPSTTITSMTTGGTQAAPSVPGQNSGNGAVNLRSVRQFA